MPLLRRRFRDYLPKGLYWRTILIILVPAAILQIGVTLIFLDDHWQATSKRMSQGVASDVALLIQLYERSPSDDTLSDVGRIANLLRLSVALHPRDELEAERCSVTGSVVDRYLTRALSQELSRDVWYDSSCPGNQVRIRVPIDGGVFEIFAYRDRVQARSGPLFVAWIFCATIFLAIVSIIFIRNQVRPIERLADAMERFGRGEEDEGIFRARGAREVRQATHAFFDMRGRIKRHIDQRAQLLAGVSHDLRTPLTRLKLQFALMPSTPELEAAKHDLGDMESTLEEYLAFARGEQTEDQTLSDIGMLVRDVARAAQNGGATIDLSVSGALTAPIRPHALKRAIVNLVDNAVAHGDNVRVTARRDGSVAEIAIDDDGPGIPPELYEDAFRPFSRLDETRTRNAKGVGLGLAIARDVARAHGGEVTLSKSVMGGLRATLRLPTPA
ncbi:MAG: ATP-binding protein [Caulobacterales bacterium]